MTPIDAVYLCDHYDLKAFIGDHMARDNPWVRLRSRAEVNDVATIRHAIVFSPDPGALDAYPNLKLVSCVGAGVDALLKDGRLRGDVMLSRAIVPEQAQCITAFAMHYIVGWQRQLWSYQAQQGAGLWHPVNRTPPSAFPVGVLGYGEIGKMLARTLKSLGYPVTAYGFRARNEDGIAVLSGPDGLARIAAESRAVINLLPLTPETKGILSAGVLSQMRGDAILMNLGRGGHLHEPDLIPALDAGRPARVLLDVFAQEPLPVDHPFWTHPQIMITPHVAGDADFRDVARFIADGIAEVERGGVPAGLVDRSRGY